MFRNVLAEDREEPRLEVRAALELGGRTKGLQICLLHEIPRHPAGAASTRERGAAQAVDVGERFGGEIRLR